MSRLAAVALFELDVALLEVAFAVALTVAARADDFDARQRAIFDARAICLGTSSIVLDGSLVPARPPAIYGPEFAARCREVESIWSRMMPDIEKRQEAARTAAMTRQLDALEADIKAATKP